jgi:hypothetical protein
VYGEVVSEVDRVEMVAAETSPPGITALEGHSIRGCCDGSL